jgi:uncharacterized membrane protein
VHAPLLEEAIGERATLRVIPGAPHAAHWHQVDYTANVLIDELWLYIIYYTNAVLKLVQPNQAVVVARTQSINAFVEIEVREHACSRIPQP